MFMVLSSRPKSLQAFIWWIQTKRQVAANPQTKPTDLGCESSENWLLTSTSPMPLLLLLSPWANTHFIIIPEGGRLSQHRHCSRGVQPVPKAVYRSNTTAPRVWFEPWSSHTAVRCTNNSATETSFIITVNQGVPYTSCYIFNCLICICILL